MSEQASRVPVVVVGAGPTGATAAALLGQRGVGCLVLDRYPDVYPLPRAVHFDDEVFRIFAGLGIADEVREISRPAPGMQLIDTTHRVLAEFRRNPEGGLHGFPQANMFDQPELERLLRQLLARTPSVDLRTGVEVYAVEEVRGGPAAVRVRYRHVTTGIEHEIWADAVLGCDGANSFTRDVVGATMADFHFAQQWLVIDVDSPEPLRAFSGVQQVCDHDRAATFMMVVPGRYRWEFRLKAGEHPDDVDEATVLTLIRPWLDGVNPDKLTILRRAFYTFRGRVADRWRNGGVFLLGDAAHQTPPFIGQGLCAGIRDAHNLAWKLALTLAGQADDTILDTYEAERRPYARRVVQMAIAVGWLMTGGSTRTARTRRAALKLASRLPGAEDKVLNAAWPAFSGGPLVSCARGDHTAGRLLPQPRINLDTGTAWLDAALGDGFAVIYRGPDRVAAFDAPTRAYFEHLGTTFLRIGDSTSGRRGDHSGALNRLLDDAGADALLVRPDHVVAATATSPDLRVWKQQLERAGINPRAMATHSDASTTTCQGTTA